MMTKEIILSEGRFKVTVIWYREQWLTSFDKVYGLTDSEVIDYLVFISKVMNLLEDLKKEIVQ